MAQKKEGTESKENKPGVKIQDLSPKKDAKGGGGFKRSEAAGGGSSLAGGGSSAAGGGSSAAGGGSSAAGGGSSAAGNSYLD